MGTAYAGFAYEFEVTRNARFYVFHVLLPLALIVFMSWTVFWLDPNHIPAQISVSITSILTLIAYRFALGHMVPPLSYLTRLDKFLIACSLLVFLALVEAIVTSNLVGQQRVATARRMDRYCRVLFPVAFVISVFAVL